MKSRAVFTLLLAACAITAQVPITPAAFVAMVKPPALPAITEGLLPGEGWVPGPYRLREQAIVFNTWRPTRRRLATLKAGAALTILSGLCEVSKPDLVTVTSPVPELQLNPGDRLLRYTDRGEGSADFWANGRWYSDADGAFITETDGTGCWSQCKARVTESGRKTWWLRVRLADGRIGWTDAVASLTPDP